MNNDFLAPALEKLGDRKNIKGQKERAMMSAVAAALESFCRQDAEFSQAVAQGGSFAECMTAVAAGTGSSISDLDAYKKAVQFYFKGADVKFQMSVEVCPGVDAAPAAPKGVVLDLEDFI